MPFIEALREQIEFDLNKPTVRDMKDVVPRMGSGKMAAIQELFHFVVVRCPETWGSPDSATTYLKMPIMGDEMVTLYKLFREASQAERPDIPYAAFDLTRITGLEFDEAVETLTGGDVVAQAKIIAQYITSCPVVKDPKNWELYMDLRYYTQFRPLVKRFQEASKDGMENFLSQFGS